ncbi:hypothetical protein TNCV_537341 [Trichonephila clavipes]|nr:hypothetical protein TNCV_537341 [Trichonephila clavipes]
MFAHVCCIQETDHTQDVFPDISGVRCGGGEISQWVRDDQCLTSSFFGQNVSPFNAMDVCVRRNPLKVNLPNRKYKFQFIENCQILAIPHPVPFRKLLDRVATVR